MSRLTLVLAAVVSVTGCDEKRAAGPGPLTPDPAGPLACDTTPCRPLQAEVEAQCKTPGTSVKLASVSGYTVLKAETDPQSVVFTSFKWYFDASGALVGRSTFANEYSRASEEGLIPRGPWLGERPACAGR